MKRIARPGDVQATASASTAYGPPAATGKWTAGPVTPVTAAPAAAQGQAVVTSASCVFTFKGTLSDGTSAPFETTSPITLSAAPHPLRVGGRHPLVDTNRQVDSWGNQLEVSSSATWRTS